MFRHPFSNFDTTMSENSTRPSALRRALIYGRYRFQTSPLRHRAVSFRHRRLSEHDVFLASYPKSGNTWLRHLLGYLVTGESTPWRGGINLVSDLIGRHDPLPKVARGDGRLIKTHEPFNESYRRAIVLVRDGRDVAVSEFFFQQAYTRHFYLYHDSFETFLKLWLQGKTNGYRSWHNHVLSWNNAAQEDQRGFLILRFEDFKQDTLGSLRKVVDYAGLQADDQLLQAAIDDCSIDSMKRKERDYWEAQGQPNRNFVRGGKSGGWRDYFTPELEELFWRHAGQAMTEMGYPRKRLDSQ